MNKRDALRPDEVARYDESAERARRMARAVTEVIGRDHRQDGSVDLSAGYVALALVSGYLIRTIIDSMDDETDQDEMLARFLNDIRVEAQRDSNSQGQIEMPIFRRISRNGDDGGIM